jgi:YfiH family protein
MDKPTISNHGRILGISAAPPDGRGGIRCLFTTMRNSAGDAVLDFDHRKGDVPAVRESYRAAADWFGVDASSIFVMRQVHGDDITVIRKLPDPSQMRAAVPADGAVTDLPGLVLTVLTADCLPILLADPKRRVVAAVHAGWRSSVVGIAEKAVGVMREVLGCEPADICAALGPAIGPCCFEVGPEVAEAARDAFGFADDYLVRKPGGKAMLDLAGLNRAVLVAAGVRAGAIRSADLCTYCNDDLFHSYRRQGEGTGRMLAGIMIEE